MQRRMVTIPSEYQERQMTDTTTSSPSASQQFEGRGADDLNTALTLSLDRLFNGPQNGLDLSKLCIVPGQQCWVIYVDAMVKILKDEQERHKD